jgi:hypothetical protein
MILFLKHNSIFIVYNFQNMIVLYCRIVFVCDIVFVKNNIVK